MDQQIVNPTPASSTGSEVDVPIIQPGTSYKPAGVFTGFRTAPGQIYSTVVNTGNPVLYYSNPYHYYQSQQANYPQFPQLVNVL